jgi:hypothetical protein
MGADMRPFFIELRASLINFPIFVCWQRLMARVEI